MKEQRPDLESLTAWRTSLVNRIVALRSEIASRQGELSRVEESLNLVSRLIEVEGGGPDLGGSNGLLLDDPGISSEDGRRVSLDLEDAVETILAAAGEPLHISQIREELVLRGVPIPGRGDDANIIVRIGRVKERFVRTGRGTYALVSWGLPSLPAQRRQARSKR